MVRDRRMGTHLWFILTNPDPTNGKVVMVALVSEKAHTERTVRLHIGDHPFVKHASSIDFGSARYAPAERLADGIASGQASLDVDMTAELLKRVREGLIASSHTINEIAAYCREVFGD